MEELFIKLKRKVKHWWISLLVGILALILAVWALVTPIETLTVMIYVFIIMFFISGISDIGFAMVNRNAMRGWGWGLMNGILEVIFGIILLIIPATLLITILLYLIGFWVLFRSVWSVGEAIELQIIGIRGWGWLLALGILGIIASIIFIISPVFAGIFVVALISLALMFYGIFRIYLAFGLRRINKLISQNE
ncbi:MAG: hypothetical protein GX876_04440 [Bacteroidales bacterium]|nr:hypothetical protein [Bacteroidales bacterium]